MTFKHCIEFQMPNLDIRDSINYLKFYKTLEMIYVKFLLIFPQMFVLKDGIFIMGLEKMFKIMGVQNKWHNL